MFITACVRFWKHVYLCTGYFGRVAKSARYLHHVRPYTRISTVPAGRISVRLDIEDFYEYLSRNSRFLDLAKNQILCMKVGVVYLYLNWRHKTVINALSSSEIARLLE
jgi:hypothetical protein